MEAHQTPVEGLRRQSIQMLWKETSYEQKKNKKRLKKGVDKRSLVW